MESGACNVGYFWGMGVGISCGVGWGPGFGPEVIGYVGGGCGIEFSVGLTLAGVASLATRSIASEFVQNQVPSFDEKRCSKCWHITLPHKSLAQKEKQMTGSQT
ncbi:hypothetical protein Ancab_015845 [Ancistrocladus abbreviatus]